MTRPYWFTWHVLDMLRAFPGGLTVNEMMTIGGYRVEPETVRACIHSLRANGYRIERVRCPGFWQFRLLGPRTSIGLIDPAGYGLL